MKQQTVTRDQALKQAILLLKKGRFAESKQILFKILHKLPLDSEARTALRKLVASERCVSPAKFAERVEATLISDPKRFISTAAAGWLFSTAIDAAFVDSGIVKAASRKPLQKAPGKRPPESEAERSASDTLLDLLQVRDLEERWRRVGSLVSSETNLVTADSFASRPDRGSPACWIDDQTSDGVNIVIIGGGCVGLALANALKIGLGEKVDILVIEKRISKPHYKRPYSRHWVTNISQKLFTGMYDFHVEKLLSDFGDNGYIGGTISVIETLLLISNKKLGVRFLFENQLDLSFIRDSKTHLLFDASGGRFKSPTSSSHITQLPSAPTSFNFEVNALKGYGNSLLRYGLSHFPDTPKMTFELIKEGDRFLPHRDGTRIETAMFKLTNLPTSLNKSLVEFCRPRNKDNLFYVWPGKLRSNINQILVLINLDKPGYDCMSEFLPQSSKLDDFIQNGGLGLQGLDTRIVELIDHIRASGVDLSQIGIEPPFLYAPYVKLLNGKFDRLYGRPIVPIGDSTFNGHPKVGNGLEQHLLMVSRIHDIMLYLFGQKLT